MRSKTAAGATALLISFSFLFLYPAGLRGQQARAFPTPEDAVRALVEAAKAGLEPAATA